MKRIPTSTAEAVAQIDAALRRQANPERAVQEKRYLKSSLSHLGASMPALRRVAKEFLAGRPATSRPELLALVEALWAVRVHEHRMVAVELLDLRDDLLEEDDLDLLERLLRESRTWALVDNLAAGPAGALVERCPAAAAALDRWAADEDFWVRRSALLALLLPLRRGEGDFERFARYADSMLEDREFFLRKAIGWVLRETGKRRPALVHAWLLPRARRASGLTVREAVKHLPEALRAEILAAREKA
jgi:3-methyladenine DNA glycosylase AlkD